MERCSNEAELIMDFVDVRQGLAVCIFLPIVLARLDNADRTLLVGVQYKRTGAVRGFLHVTFKGPMVQHLGGVLKEGFGNCNFRAFEVQFKLVFILFPGNFSDHKPSGECSLHFSLRPPFGLKFQISKRQQGRAAASSWDFSLIAGAGGTR